jgi:tRNA(His) guanylyltransferase
MEEYDDIVLAFGESDEFRCVLVGLKCTLRSTLCSFLFRKSTSLYNRRQSKIVSTLTSLFTSCYVFYWKEYFPDTHLRYPPSFDGRIVLYPTEREVRDYFAWRQADSGFFKLLVNTHN